MNPIIGLGTGRCGTRSLARFFKEHGVPAKHEYYKLRWHPSCEPKERLDGVMENISTTMDVGFYWLMYVPMVIRKYPNAKFVCLERDKELVIKSFMKSGDGLNPIITFLNLCRRGTNEVSYYRETVSNDELEKMDPATREFVKYMWDTPMMRFPDMEDRFPNYKIYDPKEFLSKYCDEYHSAAVYYEKEYPDNFLRIELNHALNTVGGRKRVLNHIGMAPNTTIQ